MLALEFVLYATGEVGQLHLSNNRYLVPANVTVKTDSTVGTFITKLKGRQSIHRLLCLTTSATLDRRRCGWY